MSNMLVIAHTIVVGHYIILAYILSLEKSILDDETYTDRINKGLILERI